MNIRAKSTLAVAITMLLAGGTAAADDRAIVDDGIGKLGVTMQVLDGDSTEPTNLLTLPSTANSDHALSASEQGKAHAQALADSHGDTDHGNSGDHQNDDQGDDEDSDTLADKSEDGDHGDNAHNDPDANDHGQTVSGLAHDLKTLHDEAESGKDFAEMVRQTVVDAATDHAKDAAEHAADAAEHAAEEADEAAEHAAEAADEAADAAEHTAENAAEHAADAADHAADAAGLI